MTGVVLCTKGQEPESVEAGYVVAAPGRGGADWLNHVAHDNGIDTKNNEVDIRRARGGAQFGDGSPDRPFV